jgi:hypothetical protein
MKARASSLAPLICVLAMFVAVFDSTRYAEGSVKQSGDGLRVSSSGHYFTYNGKTVMLVGDSGTQCVMQNLKINYRQWIDDLAAKRVNAAHIWAVVAPRQEQDGSVVEARYGYVYPGTTPWRRRTTGPNATDQLKQWDLSQFDEGTDPNAHYWPRLRDLVAYAKEKNMCVAITLFFGWPKWDTAQRPDWSYHPFNVVNGGHLTDNNAVQMIASPGQEVLTEKWSDAWPAAKKTQWIWERFCDKMIRDVGICGNVFFVFMDEHSYSEGNCGDHFLNFFKKRGQVYVDWDARRESVDAVYTGTRTSTNRNSRTVNEFNQKPSRPIMLLEGPPYELGSPGLRQSMWTFAIAGGHFFFHDDQGEGTPQTGIMGYDPNVKGGVKPLKTYKWLGIMAEFFNTRVLDLDKMTPRNDLIAGATDAYCLANAGSEYAVYLRSGGNVTLKLSEIGERMLNVEWLNPDSGQYTSGGTITERKRVTLVPPSSPEKDWVVHVFTATPGAKAWDGAMARESVTITAALRSWIGWIWSTRIRIRGRIR